jgi:triosephosphate isomerase
MRFLVINTKNYLEASGKKLDKLAESVYSASHKASGSKMYLAVPAFDLRYLHTNYPGLNLLTQHLDDSPMGSSTGALVPEISKIAGACGSIINHSERRLDTATLTRLVSRLRDLKLVSVVCARDENEVSTFASLGPDFVAIEPPELIGSGNAVSKVSPEIISRSKSVLIKSKPANSKTRLLCGAGIVDREDARRAVELGAEGILVASGVVLTSNWKKKILDLLLGLSAV